MGVKVLVSYVNNHAKIVTNDIYLWVGGSVLGSGCLMVGLFKLMSWLGA